jgi:hypothetical protein
MVTTRRKLIYRTIAAIRVSSRFYINIYLLPESTREKLKSDKTQSTNLNRIITGKIYVILDGIIVSVNVYPKFQESGPQIKCFLYIEISTAI